MPELNSPPGYYTLPFLFTNPARILFLGWPAIWPTRWQHKWSIDPTFPLTRGNRVSLTVVLKAWCLWDCKAGYAYWANYFIPKDSGPIHSIHKYSFIQATHGLWLPPRCLTGQMWAFHLLHLELDENVGKFRKTVFFFLSLVLSLHFCSHSGVLTSPKMAQITWKGFIVVRPIPTCDSSIAHCDYRRVHWHQTCPPRCVSPKIQKSGASTICSASAWALIHTDSLF